MVAKTSPRWSHNKYSLNSAFRAESKIWIFKFYIKIRKVWLLSQQQCWYGIKLNQILIEKEKPQTKVIELSKEKYHESRVWPNFCYLYQYFVESFGLTSDILKSFVFISILDYRISECRENSRREVRLKDSSS